jgi:demethylmenaquinone methyltransferase/2-methoxy-6-polyprenyl-1,4-benzoquinol methylase
MLGCLAPEDPGGLFLEQVARLADVREGQRIVDVCCGMGSQALRFAEHKAIANGIDLDPRMTRLAEGRRKRRDLQQASFQTASALELPFRDNTFDCASISMSFHETAREHRGMIISEMTRVVIEGGRIVLADYAVPQSRSLSGYLPALFERVAGRENYACYRDYVAHGGLPGLLRRTQLQTEATTTLSPVVVIVTRNGKG